MVGRTLRSAWLPTQGQSKVRRGLYNDRAVAHSGFPAWHCVSMLTVLDRIVTYRSKPGVLGFTLHPLPCRPTACSPAETRPQQASGCFAGGAPYEKGDPKGASGMRKVRPCVTNGRGGVVG